MKASLPTPLGTLLLAGLALFPACSKKQEPSPEAKVAAAPAAPAYKTVADAPEAQRKELDAFARKLEKDLKEGNATAVKGTFDTNGIVTRIIAGVDASGSKFDDFKKGLNQGLRQNLDFVIKMWTEQEVTYKHLVVHEGRLKPRFRLISEGSGISLLDFTVEANGEGKPAIVDFYNQALGSGMVEQSRQASLPVLGELDKSFLQRVLGKSSSALKDIEAFGRMTDQFRKQDFKGAAATFETLPADLQANLAANAIHLAALQQSGDNEGYMKALKKSAQVHKSANFQFMLVDLYFLEKNYDKAIECLDVFMGAVEKDAALLALKGLLQMIKGDHAAAAGTVKEGLALEPTCIYAHTKGVDVFLAAKDFAATADSMKFLESTGKFNFKSTLGDPAWAEFMKSPASQPWR